MIGEKLPKDWSLKSFTDVFDIQGGTQPPKSQFIDEPKKGYIRLLQIRDFGAKPVPTYIPDNGKWNTCSKDDILIARYGASIGRIVSGQEGAYNVALAKVTIPQEFDKRFALWLLKSNLFQNFITSFQRTAQSGFNKNDLKGIILPIAPYIEQQRIVTKLDQIFSHLENAKKGLEKIPVLLKQFRQAVLTQAVTGKLTKCDVEIKKLNDLLIDVKYGTSKKSEYETEGTPIFRIPNISEGEINDSDLKFSVLEEKEFSQLKLLENDVLIIRSNGSVNLVGRSAIIRKSHINFSFAGYLIRLRCNTNLNGDFLNYMLQSDFLRNQIVSKSHSSSGVNNINSQEIKDLLIYFTSIENQIKIVNRVKGLFAKANAIEIRYKILKEKIDNLPQAVLAKAFRGEI